MTLGFPIDVNVPPGYEYRNAVAEVEVSVCAVAGTAGETPSVVTILPQAKTYNVASLVSKSTQIGAGAVSQVVNFAGSLFHSRQTYYIVKDQDTVAIQALPDRSTHECRAMRFEPDGGFNFKNYRPAVFGWRFKPVLGQRVVQDGLRQSFVQLAFSPEVDVPNSRWEASLSCEENPVQIQVGWRHYDPGTGRVGEKIGPYRSFTPKVPAYIQNPAPISTTYTDNEDGTLTVILEGGFSAGSYIRIGNLVLFPQQVAPGSASATTISTGGSGGQTPASTGSSNNTGTGNTAANNNSGGNAANPPSQNNATSNNSSANGNNSNGGGSNQTAGNTNNSGGNTANNAGNPGNNSGGSANSNQTTLQIQGTVQITAAPSSPSTTGSGNAGATQQLAPAAWVTSRYIKFIARADLIARYGAMLVTQDGREGDINNAYIIHPVPTCQKELADYAAQFNPEINSAKSDTALVGKSYSYQIKAKNLGADSNNTTYTVSGRPPWLNLDPNKGILSGTAPGTGEWKMKLTASSITAGGKMRTATGPLDLTAKAGGPTIGPPGNRRRPLWL